MAAAAAAAAAAGPALCRQGHVSTLGHMLACMMVSANSVLASEMDPLQKVWASSCRKGSGPGRTVAAWRAWTRHGPWAA